MKPFLKVAEQYYVLANSVFASNDTRVLKQGETFAILDAFGDIQSVTHQESGLFHKGTRHISHFEFNIFEDLRPLLLNSVLRDDNGVLKIDMTNPDFSFEGLGFVPKGTLYIHREKFLLSGHCFEQVSFSNYGSAHLEFDASYRIEADFADIFEVRGEKRARRGVLEPVVREEQNVVIAYEGLDGIKRYSCFTLSERPFTLDEGNRVRFKISVPAKGQAWAHATTRFHRDDEDVGLAEYTSSLKRVHSDHMTGRKRFSPVLSSNEQFDNWLRRSTDDLVVMTTQMENGCLYPYAGTPWYCAPFGRDGIITAMECLWANPLLAKGVLEYLAATQAREHNVEQDATPGKIIHEARDGEMANLKEIPFGRYYGSVDSTPLFVCLGGMYLTCTNDVDTIRKLWPAFEKAIDWMDRYGDLDGDGFLEYERENPNGLVQQGWKDSDNSVFHADDTDAPGPIALCEAQGYAYYARIQGALMADVVGHPEFADDLRRKAADLQEKFDRSFWLEDLGTYALALDGQKKPCRVVSSNAGHCLFTEIAKPERVEPLVRTLMRPESFSGWGVRTLSSEAVRFNPMSYHNGSVWPHDVALIAWGYSKHGYKDESVRLFNGLFRAATYMELLRMPEVFCGFTRREGEAPTLYPHACSPQAWAAGSVYMLLQSVLGLSVDGRRRVVSFKHPKLPESIETLKLKGLRVGDREIDFIVRNYHSDVSIQIMRRSPGVSVFVER